MPTARTPMARPPMARGPIRPPASRPASLRPATAGSVDTMKVAGVLVCASAVLSIVLAAASRGPAASAERNASLGSAFAALLFGLALYQGVGAVRTFVLGCAVVGGLASLVGVALLNSARELQLLLAAVLVTCVGYLALLLERRASRGRVVIAAGLVLAGAAGSVAAQLWLSGWERRAFGRELRPLLVEQRKYDDAASGLSIEAPRGWSLLEKEAPLFATVPAKVRLADADAGAVAFLNDELQPPGLLSLDHYLDALLESQKRAGLDARQLERRDTAVGKAPARRMSISWQHAKRPYSGFVSVWFDGPRIFTLFGATVGEWSDASEERFRSLEAALRFSAPIETALSDAQARLSRECPVFTDDALRMIARIVPPSSATETYFRTGWAWAIRGQGQLDAARMGELRELMAAVFARMSPAERERFGAYSERLRNGSRTTVEDDVAAMRILGKAAAALPTGSLDRLRAMVDTSLTVGGLL